MNSQAVRQQSATARARERDEPVEVTERGPSAPTVPGEAAPAVEPERTVLRELHRMFALIAIR